MRILEVKTGGRPVQMAPIALGAQPMAPPCRRKPPLPAWMPSASGEKAAVRPSAWIPPGYTAVGSPAETEPAREPSAAGFPRSGNREKVVLSTKGGHPAEPGLPRLDRESLRRDLAESLAHLNTDHVELYFLHRTIPAGRWGKFWKA